MTFRAYLLTIDGCPCSFGTAGCPSTVTLPPGYAVPLGEWSTAWGVQVGALEWPEGTISERLATSDGQLSVGGLEFTINSEHEIVGGPYAGERILRLFTKEAHRIAQSGLAASYEAGDATLTLTSTAGFPTGDQVVWVEQEALRVSRSGSTLTVSVSPAGTGYYGSRIEDHALDSARGYSPIVFAEFPGVARRRCVLWEVDENGYATAVWRGKITRPRGDEDLRYVLSADHLWDAAKDTRLVRGGATVTIGGWFLKGSASVYNQDALIARVRTSASDVSSNPSDGEDERVCASLEELVAIVQRRLQDQLTAAGFSGLFVTITYDETDGITLTVRGPDTDFESVYLSVSEGGFDTSTDNTTSGGVRSSSVKIPPEKLTGAYLPAIVQASLPATVILDTSLGFPASFAAENASSDPLVTVQSVLLGELDDERWGEGYLLSFEPSSVDEATSSATGVFELVPKDRSVRPLLRTTRVVLSRPQTLALSTRVAAEHWAYAIDYALVSWSAARRAPLDARDWSRSAQARVVGATESTPELARANWYLDGEQTLGGLVTAQCRLNGCAVAIGPQGRMRLVPLRPPTPTDAVAATLTSADYLEGHTPRFELLDETVRTSAQFEAGKTKIVVADLDAEARYGATAPVELEAVGQLEGVSQEIVSPDLIAAQLLRYVLGVWSAPASLHTLVVSGAVYGQVIYPGDAVEFDSFVAPDGAGDRGLVGRRGLVLGREYELDGDDALTLQVLVFEAAARIAAIAPCLRVQSISGTTVTIAKDYLSGSATDYAGSNTSGYRFEDAGEDGGTSWASLCTKWKLVTRGAAPQLIQAGIVSQNYNAAARTITLTSTVPTGVQDWTAFVAGGGLADLVPDDYADVTDTERAWAYVASESAGVIDGTADVPNRWAP